MKSQSLTLAILALLTISTTSAVQHHHHRHHHSHPKHNHQISQRYQRAYQRPISFAQEDHGGVKGSQHLAFDFAEDDDVRFAREAEVSKANEDERSTELMRIQKLQQNSKLIPIGREGDYKIFNQFDGLYHHRDGSLEENDGMVLDHGANSYTYQDNQELPKLAQKQEDQQSYPYGQFYVKKQPIQQISQHKAQSHQKNQIQQLSSTTSCKCDAGRLFQREYNDSSLLQQIGHVDVADRNMDDIDIEVARKREVIRLAAEKAEREREAQEEKLTKIGPDGMVHEEDGTKKDPNTGQVIEDDDDAEDDNGNKLPKKDDFAKEAKNKNQLKRTQKAQKKADEARRRLQNFNSVDGLIHMDGQRIDPNDGVKVESCQCV